MKILPILLSIMIVIQPCMSIPQTVGGAGRTTGNKGIHGSFNVSTSGLTVSCSSSAACSVNPTSGTVNGPNQLAGGIIQFTATHDGSGTIGGSAGGGAGELLISCNGGPTFAVTIASYSLPTTSASMSYLTPTCSGVTNLNQITFQSTLGGGGSSGFNMNFFPSSTITMTF